jgi:hypothetical protein
VAHWLPRPPLPFGLSVRGSGVFGSGRRHNSHKCPSRHPLLRLVRPLSIPPAGPGASVFTRPRTAQQKLPAPLTQFFGPSALPAGTVTNMRRGCLARLRSRYRVHPSCGFARCLLRSHFPDCRAHGLYHLRGLSSLPAGFPSRAPIPHAVSPGYPGRGFRALLAWSRSPAPRVFHRSGRVRAPLASTSWSFLPGQSTPRFRVHTLLRSAVRSA